MRKCRFEDAEVPLWECGSAALSAISHCRMTFFALLAMLFIYFCATRPCLHLIKTGKKRRRNGFPKRCFWYEKSVWILRFIGLTYVNAYIGTANSPFFQEWCCVFCCSATLFYLHCNCMVQPWHIPSKHSLHGWFNVCPSCVCCSIEYRSCQYNWCDFKDGESGELENKVYIIYDFRIVYYNLLYIILI